jgi:hypothetical protein
MTQEITQDAIRALSEVQLESVGEWVQEERKARAERHKQETLAKIRELARSIEVGIKIEGVRGRPAKSGSESTASKAARR